MPLLQLLYETSKQSAKYYNSTNISNNTTFNTKSYVCGFPPISLAATDVVAGLPF